MKLLKSYRRGFTLIELALVIATMSILFIVMFSVNFTVSKIAKKNVPISSTRSQAMLVLNLIQNSIRMAYFFPEIEKTVFYGKSNGNEGERADQLTLTCVSTGSPLAGGGIVKEVSFYRKDNSLYIREDQIVDDQPYVGGNHYKILEGVKSFQLSYSLNGVDWQDNWSSKSTRRIPRLVKIRIVVAINYKDKEELKTIKEETYETIAIPGYYLR
ncbi:MAG: type II secretory pathway [Leptospiraceae bacterium]|nr:MAG: type II secretory pathway [Leptospiraceae bacterium]